MNSKNLLIGVAILVAVFIAGMQVQRQTQPVPPVKQKPQTASKSAIIPVTPNPAQTALTVEPAARPISSDSSISKLSPDERNALLQNNPTALAYAQTITGDLNFGYIAIRIAKKWSADDPREALAWAQGLPPGTAHDDVLKLIFTLLGPKDPAGALSLAQSLPDAEKARALDGLANNAITQSMQDPAQAAAFLNSLNRTESSISPDNPTAMVTMGWMMRDPAAASQWIGTLPAGNTRDSAILAAVTVQGDSDPASAFTMLRTMSNAGKRGTTTTSLVTQWAKKDPPAATAAVMQAYPNNNNGRQAALLAIIQQNTAPTSANPQ